MSANCGEKDCMECENESLRAEVRDLRAKLRDRDARLKALAEQHATSWCNCESEVNWQCRGHEIANLRNKSWRKARGEGR